MDTKNVTINLLFLQCEDTDNFSWYEKMRAGLSDNQIAELRYRKNRTIAEYNDAVQMLNNEKVFIEMQQKGKLIIG